MEVANEIMKRVIQVLMVPVKKQLDYLVSYKKYVEDMRTKMKDLDAERVDVESKKKQNRKSGRHVPETVDLWLIEVEQMNEKIAGFPSDEVLGCLDLKSRHNLGRKAFKISEQIKSVLGRRPQILGTEAEIPLGEIDSRMASIATPSGDHNDFESRNQTYNKALEALGPKHCSHMVALCGMPGVGKTTMMKKLRQAVIEKEMFSYFVQADIGEKPDLNAIQDSIASYLGIELNNVHGKPARVYKLRQGFKDKSTEGKKNFLVILDDVWQPVDVEDIGLSPFPNQSVDFKVLLTSRNKDVCIEMGVEADSILNVEVLKDTEPQSFFRQFVKSSNDTDLDPALLEIGDAIASRCQGLPIAIKTIAKTLKGKEKHVWEDALNRLQHNNLGKVVKEVFQLSYNNLHDKETKNTCKSRNSHVILQTVC